MKMLVVAEELKLKRKTHCTTPQLWEEAVSALVRNKSERMQVYNYTTNCHHHENDSFEKACASALLQSEQRDSLCYKICKNYSGLKAEYAKTKAVLEQRIEFQETEIEELKDRMRRDKKCYETMFAALKKDSEPKSYKHLEAIKKIHEQQVEDIQSEHRAFRAKFEAKVTDLKEKANKLEFDLKDATSQLEKLRMKYDHKLKEEEYFKWEFELKYKELEKEKQDVVRQLEKELGKL